MGGRNEELVAQIQDGKSWLIEDLWKENRGLIAWVARLYMEGCGRHYDLDDLLQAGFLGLYAAAYTYSQNRGAKFSTFAPYYIRKAMREVVGLNVKVDPILDAKSLDEPFSNEDDGTLLDIIPASEDEYTFFQEDAARIMRKAVSHIKNDYAREALEAVYWNKKDVSDYAKEKDVTPKTVYANIQKGYYILRGDPSVVSLAIAEGYQQKNIYRSHLGASPEDMAISNDEMERRQAALYKHLGNLIFTHAPGTQIDSTTRIGQDRKWCHCPNCGAKHSLFGNVAECRGVFLKCDRGCKQVFELVIKEGQQRHPETGATILPESAK